MKKITFFAMLLFSSIFYGQVSDYAFSQSSGIYTAITGTVAQATTATVTLDSEVSTNLPIGFTFIYNGVTYTSFGINANGWISMGATAPISNSTPLSTGTINNVISAFSADLYGRQFITATTTSASPTITMTAGSLLGVSVGDAVTGTGIATGSTVVSISGSTVTLSANATSAGTGRNIRFMNGKITYATIGTAPNQQLVVQFSKFSRYTTSAPSDFLNFQIILNEASNVIDIVYDIPYINAAATRQVGLRGAANTDFNNRLTTTDWSATNAGTANTSTCSVSNTIFPASGLKFTWTPPVLCTGTPTAGTATSAATVVCSGLTTSLNLTGNTTGVSGLTYQWQSSPAGANTFTDIAGATTKAYTATVTANTDYQCVVTCTNGGATATSTIVTVNLFSFPAITTVGAPTTYAVGNTVVLSLTGLPVGTTYTYQWQSNVNGAGYTNVAALGTSATYSAVISATPTTYQCVITACTPAITTTSSEFVPAPVAGYCVASSTSQASYISNFTTTGGSVNIAHTATVGAAGGYQDLTATVKVSNYIGNTTNISITSANPTVGNAIWIDWNNNSIFETTERMFVTAGYITTATGTITIPVATPNGNYRMRVVTDFGVSAPVDPCRTVATGEYKEFTFEVIDAPTPITVSGSTSVCAGTGTPLTVSSANTNYTYTWSPATGLSATTGASVTATPTATTTYTVTAVDGTMTTSGTTTVTVMATPTAVIVTPATTTICPNTIQSLVATGGMVPALATIGTGTTLSTAIAQPTAFCNRWPNYWSQTIYTAAELTAAGAIAGNITSLAYNITTLGDGATNANFTVKIGTSASAAFASTTFVPTTGFTTVFGPFNYTHTATGWQTITFATPYLWDGTSDIVINVTHDGANSINNSQTYYTATTDNKTLWVNSYSGTTTTGAYSLNRLNIALGYNGSAPTIWSPTTGLYTDVAATIAYTGTALATVYAKPSATTTYTATATAGTCTKTATSDVTVTTVDNTVAQVVATLTANQVGATYQWYTCPSNVIISGETGQSFTATVNGDYGVTVTLSGCSVDSACTTISTLGVNSFDIISGFKAYPNPVTNILNIEYAGELSNVKVYNLLGQQMLTKKIAATSTQIDMSGLNPGTYLVKVEANNASKTIKVVKR